MEHHRRPHGPPPWEDADGWVVAGEEEEAGWSAPVDGHPGYGPEGAAAGPAPSPYPYPPAPDPWYGQPATYGEDPYRPEDPYRAAAQPAYWPAQPQPQPYAPPVPQAAPPDAGFRWYREVAPGQWVPSDPPANVYPAEAGHYPAPQQYPPAPPPPPVPDPRVPEQYGAAARSEPVPPPVSAPVRREPPPVDRPAPGPWQPPRRSRREPPPLPDLDDDAADPPGAGAEASTLSVLSWTLCYFLVPVLAYLGWAFTRSDVTDPTCVDETGAPCMSPRGEAIEALVNVGPALAAALFLAAVAAVVMRRLTASWRASMVGFAAAVVGGAAATLVAGILR